MQKRKKAMKRGDIIRDREHPEVVGIVIDNVGSSTAPAGAYRVYPLSDNWSYKGNPTTWFNSAYIENLFEVVG